jgi:hypothetical protein
MGTWQIALVREQGVEFAVIVVQDHVIDSPGRRDELIAHWATYLQRPAALMGAQRHRTYGRRDLVDWLATIHPSQLPWRRMAA